MLLLFILLSVVILLLLSGGYVFFVACAKRKEIDWLDEEAAAKTPNGRFHPCMVDTDRWLREHHAQDVYVTAHDGAALHALWIPVKNSKGTVLMAHGYRSTMLLDLHLGFELFHRLGMNILAPEQRTHGESGGHFITFGVKESRDMQCWIDYHNQQLSCQDLLLYGISMGASTMLYLADRELPENLRGIIADCGFTSARDIISEVYEKVLHLPAAPSVWIADGFARVIGGFSFDACDTRRSLSRSRVPILLIHGQADDFVPCRMSEEAYAACRTEKMLLLVADAEHGMSFLTDGLRYTAAVIDFMKKHIPGFFGPGKKNEV